MHARVALGTVSLYSNNMTDAIALIEGRIQEILVRESDHVSKGQTLFRIVNEQYPVRLRQADLDILKADQNVTKAEGAISKAEAELARATNDYARYGSLREIGAVATQKYEEIEAVYKSALVNLDIAHVQKEQALADLAHGGLRPGEQDAPFEHSGGLFQSLRLQAGLMNIIPCP